MMHLGGSLPEAMGVRPGVQLGTYPTRVFGFGLDARMMPPVGCSCKVPHRRMRAAEQWVRLQPAQAAMLSTTGRLVGLL